MAMTSVANKRLFVLDTNVLVHDPYALFRFEEHDLFIPMVVLEELDQIKKGVSDIARSVRQVNRLLNELIEQAAQQGILLAEGVPIARGETASMYTPPQGRLFFERELETPPMVSFPTFKADNSILASALAQTTRNDATVILVTKDINLRIKASIAGLAAQDYYSDRVSVSAEILAHSTHELNADFWAQHAQGLEAWQEEETQYYRIKGPAVSHWHPNDCLISAQDGFRGIVKSCDHGQALVRIAHDYTHTSHALWGISARNDEQNLAMNLLMDPDIDFITIQGTAGTGKTLLALAAGLTQTLEINRYRDLIITRVTVPIGEDIGYLPGTEEEKMAPWMGALSDNLDILCHNDPKDEWGKAATRDFIMSRLKVRAMNFMRGRTFYQKYVIIDEAQNLTPRQIKILITRAGPGTKIVCLGDVQQIDTPYLSENTSGLSYAIERFKDWPYSAHITLTKGERSRLADFAAAEL